MKAAFYNQCVLRKRATEQVAWLPEEFAKEGKFVRIKDSNGWKVLSVGIRQSGDFLLEHEREHLRHRSITDV